MHHPTVRFLVTAHPFGYKQIVINIGRSWYDMEDAMAKAVKVTKAAKLAKKAVKETHVALRGSKRGKDPNAVQIGKIDPSEEIVVTIGLAGPKLPSADEAVGQTLSPEEFARRRASAGAMVRDNGVTYNVYDETAGQTRPWQLDIVPFILSAADWRDIEAAVTLATKAKVLLDEITK